MSESRIIYLLEETHLKHEPGETYIAFDDLDVEFRWTVAQVNEFDRLWEEGRALHTIAHHFNRTQLETGLLLADRAEKGFCKPRKNGLN